MRPRRPADLVSRCGFPVAVVLAGAIALGIASAAPAAPRCTGVPTRGCLLPFPNDFALTKRDASTPTGRRVAFSLAEMPANSSGTHIDPTELNRNDGFSPGEPIIVHVAALNSQAAFKRARIVPVNDLAQYMRPNQPLLLLDEATGRREDVGGRVYPHLVPRREPQHHPPSGQEPRSGTPLRRGTAESA